MSYDRSFSVSLQIIIEAEIGRGISNDMALDDISITNQPCQSKFYCYLFIVRSDLEVIKLFSCST